MATESVAASTRPAIIVAVNATRRCSETLEMAAALATATGANLEVVYVEDENLLRLADLPVTREIDRVSGAAREMDSGRIRRALQCEARRLRNELARIGRATAVRSTVRIVRGHVLGEALAASRSVDIAFVQGAQRTLPGSRLPRGLSIAPPGSRRLRRPVLTLFKGGAESVRALRVATKLARSVGTDLTVLVPSEGAERCKREALEVAEHGEMRFVEGAEGRTLMLGRMLTPMAGRLLVLAKRSPELDDDATRNYLEELSIPLVLVA